MITIYCLASEDVIWYVGSTEYCKRREWHHRSLLNDCSSSDIPEGVEWKMIALEEVEKDIRYDAERFYYEWLEPKLNRKVPGRTDKEYKLENKDRINEKQRNKYHQLKTKEKV